MEPRPTVVLGDDADVSALLPQLERLAMASKALSFDVGDYVVYPKHGVGRVVELQSTEIAGTRLDLYVLHFEKEKMTLRVPVNKADSVGMRKLSSDKTMKDALETLKGKPKVKRTMWSRRAQEYEAKINSGDLTSIAEVTRDLFRPDDAPEQSYSERQIFEAASSRIARGCAVTGVSASSKVAAKVAYCSFNIPGKARLASDPFMLTCISCSSTLASWPSSPAADGRPASAFRVARMSLTALCSASISAPV